MSSQLQFGGFPEGTAGVKDSQLSVRPPVVPQRFLELLPKWLVIDASLFQDTMESFGGGVLQIQIQEVFKLYAKSIHSFNLG